MSTINQILKITGKVQGVYYRASAKQKAMNLGVQGYVKNEPDGSVLLEVQGAEAAVNEMVNWCKKGPMLARVKHIDIANQTAKKLVSFDIKK